MDFSELIAIPVITVICFLVAEGIKATKLDNKWLPIWDYDSYDSNPSTTERI